MSKGSRKTAPAGDVLANHRRARRDYEILDRFEAGLELRGTEVKAIRDGRLSIEEAFATVEGDELFLRDMRVEPYSHGNVHNHEPRRPRKLLLHRAEINRLIGRIREKGLTLIPLKVYLKRGKVKVELGLGKGRNVVDKRETMKRRDQDREMRRAMAHHLKRG
ncbi:SsrA-binding protein SmpB [Kiritimatiella glycovorans]|uniref:SsrA-binding protein n=1 Tax=Kiritimatiella glycovorans TaxID=1307763 RepID=A0A0G3EGV8_9BACT|nr:SsrA-binding protein SmpB [Kiritimatiella glycovorans]AKJ64657.1 SsrA-binding protein [Kiritimatiella glycovorans]